MSRNTERPTRNIDRRTTRTRRRLGTALVGLLAEHSFPSIRVQHVLQRARVGRSTFYAHYRDKDDLFITEMDEHLEYFATLLSRRDDPSSRVAPVREFFTHLADAKPLYEVLVASGRLPDLLELAEAHFTRGIEQRLTALPNLKVVDQDRRNAVAAALAGALLSLLRAWMNGAIHATPEELDTIFHSLVRAG